MSSERYIQIPKVLAVLAYNGDYHHIDRLGYSHSKPLVLYYLKEALRDFHALKRSPPKDLESVPEEIKQMISQVDAHYLDVEIEQIEKISGTRELREAVSLICAKALALSSKFVGERT